MISAHAIEHSPAFRKWCRAFEEVSGIDVHLLGEETLEEDLRQVAQSLDLCRAICGISPQCALLCQKDRERFVERLRAAAPDQVGPFAMRCFSGLILTSLPVLLGDGTTAFLSTGPILLKSPNLEAPVDPVLRRIEAHASGCPLDMIHKAMAKLPVCDSRKFKATVTLLRLLAEHISHMSRRLMAVPDNGWHDGVMVRRACELIEHRFTENLRLDVVAREVGVSPSHLSHLFRRQMGLTFTEYLSGRRVIEMKRLLTNSDLNVTEVLFAAGFQSISQANRVFRANTGMAPREFRTSLQT